ncbi:MAG: hypothetical protein AAF614_25560 [Chloroflexota bacterium]
MKVNKKTTTDRQKKNGRGRATLSVKTSLKAGSVMETDNAFNQLMHQAMGGGKKR